jgi:hypothetical protein
MRGVLCRVCIYGMKRRVNMTPIVLDQPKVMQHPKDPDKWILLEDFEGVPKGFVYDFASIPRFLWWLVSPVELGDVGPLKHDWRYANKLGPRGEADKDFSADMKRDNIKTWKRKAAYAGVRSFGWMSWGKSKVVIEELIPA